MSIQAHSYGAVGDNTTAIEIAQRRWEQLSDVPGTEAARLRLATALARAHMARGDFDEFAFYNEQRVLLAEALLDRNALAHAYIHLGVYYSHVGAAETTRVLYGIAAQIAREQGTPDRLAHALSNMASIVVNRDLDAALELSEESVEAARRSGSFDWIDFTQINRMSVLWWRGDLERLFHDLTEFVETCADPTVRASLPSYVQLVGGAVGRRLECDDIPSRDEVDDVSARLFLQHHEVLVALEDGRPDDVVDTAEDLVATLTDKLGIDDDFVMLWTDCVRAVIASGQGTRAAALLQPVASALPGRVTPLAGAQLARLRGQVRALLRDDPVLVEGDLRAGVSALTRFGARCEAARAWEELGDWLLTQGRAREADEAYDEALSGYEAVGATGWLRALQERRAAARSDLFG